MGCRLPARIDGGAAAATGGAGLMAAGIAANVGGATLWFGAAWTAVIVAG